MSYTVYILECEDGSLYTGITTDIARRLRQHMDKKGGGYTTAHRARKIVYRESAKDRSTALKREAEIKSWKREKKLNLVRGIVL